MLDEEPLVSVVIPAHNRWATLGRALDSVLRQTWTRWEAVVVDDGSTDGTADVVLAHRDPRVRLLRLPERRGAAAARNAGIEATQGEWVAFLDSDDEWLPARLQAQMQALTVSPDAAVGYCLVDEVNDATGARRITRPSLPEGNVFRDLLRGRRPPTSSAFIVKRSALLEVGGFDSRMASANDIDLWLRLAQKGYRFSALNEAQVLWHIGGRGRISDNPQALLEGFHLFDRKWAGPMRRELGRRDYWRWRQRRLRKIVPAWRALLKGQARSGQLARAFGDALTYVSLLADSLRLRLLLAVVALQKGRR